MALQDGDLLAVYRETDQKNYKATVAQLFARAPSPVAPSLNAVLGTGNTSNGIDIIIEDSGGDKKIDLSATDATLLGLGLNVYGDVKIGEVIKITLEENGIISNNQTDLFGDADGLALAVYEVGTNNDNKDTKTTTVEIRNTGNATFAGTLEADKIDGGIYAAEDP